MSDREPRFDVVYRGGNSLPSIDYHFCRDCGPDSDTGELEGCYGTNPNHGLSFDDAACQVADLLREKAAYWLGLTLEEWEATS